MKAWINSLCEVHCMTKPNTVPGVHIHKSKALARVPATESRSVGNSHLVKGLVFKAILTIKASVNKIKTSRLYFYTKYTILL